MATTKSQNTYAPASPTVLKQVGNIARAALDSLAQDAEKFAEDEEKAQVGDSLATIARREIRREKLKAASDSVRLLISRFPEKDWGQGLAEDILGKDYIEQQEREVQYRLKKAQPAEGQKVHALPHNTFNAYWQLFDLIATSIYAVDVHPLGQLFSKLQPTKTEAANAELKEAIEVIKQRFPEIAWDEIDTLVNDHGEDETEDKQSADLSFDVGGKGNGLFGPQEHVEGKLSGRALDEVRAAQQLHEDSDAVASLTIKVCKHGNLTVTGGINHNRFGGEAEAQERVKAVIDAAVKNLVKGGDFEKPATKH